MIKSIMPVVSRFACVLGITVLFVLAGWFVMTISAP
jgi:hypothetical protein